MYINCYTFMWQMNELMVCHATCFHVRLARLTNKFTGRRSLNTKRRVELYKAQTKQVDVETTTTTTITTFENLC